MKQIKYNIIEVESNTILNTIVFDNEELANDYSHYLLEGQILEKILEIEDDNPIKTVSEAEKIWDTLLLIMQHLDIIPPIEPVEEVNNNE